MSEPLDRERTDVGTAMSIRGSVVDARFPQLKACLAIKSIKEQT